MVERSKRKNGSKRSQGNDEMEDVSHCKTMPLADGKNNVGNFALGGV